MDSYNIYWSQWTRSSLMNAMNNDIYVYIGQKINLFYSPIIVLLGFIGNGVSFIVYARRKQREKPLSVYMRSLAFADTGMLILFSLDWLNHRYFKQRSEGRCKSTSFIQISVFNISEYILVAITCSRLVAIVYPMRAENTATTKPRVSFYSLYIFAI